MVKKSVHITQDTHQMLQEFKQRYGVPIKTAVDKAIRFFIKRKGAGK